MRSFVAASWWTFPDSFAIFSNGSLSKGILSQEIYSTIFLFRTINHQLIYESSLSFFSANSVILSQSSHNFQNFHSGCTAVSVANLLCDFDKNNGLWKTLNSMRNVENTALMKLLSGVKEK